MRLNHGRARRTPATWKTWRSSSRTAVSSLPHTQPLSIASRLGSMCNPNAAQWPQMTVVSEFLRFGMPNQGRYPEGACSGGPENPDISPVGVQVRSLVNTRVMLTRRSWPAKLGAMEVIGRGKGLRGRFGSLGRIIPLRLLLQDSPLHRRSIEAEDLRAP